MTAPLQRWNADGYARHARFVSDLGAPVLALLAPQPGERILDLGCGDGALTQQIAAAGARVTGVDGSEDFVAAARDRGRDAHEDAHVRCDAHAHQDGHRDVVQQRQLERKPERERELDEVVDALCAELGGVKVAV